MPFSFPFGIFFAAISYFGFSGVEVELDSPLPGIQDGAESGARAPLLRPGQVVEVRLRKYEVEDGLVLGREILGFTMFALAGLTWFTVLQRIVHVARNIDRDE